MKTKDIVPGNLYALKSPSYAMRSQPLVVLDNTAMYTPPYSFTGRQITNRPLHKSRDMRASSGNYGHGDTGLITVTYGWGITAAEESRRTPEKLQEVANSLDLDAIKAGNLTVPEGYRIEFMNPTRIAMTWEDWLVAKAAADEKAKIDQARRISAEQVRLNLRQELEALAGKLGVNTLTVKQDSGLLDLLRRLERAEG